MDNGAIFEHGVLSKEENDAIECKVQEIIPESSVIQNPHTASDSMESGNTSEENQAAVIKEDHSAHVVEDSSEYQNILNQNKVDKEPLVWERSTGGGGSDHVNTSRPNSRLKSITSLPSKPSSDDVIVINMNATGNVYETAAEQKVSPSEEKDIPKGLNDKSVEQSVLVDLQTAINSDKLMEESQIISKEDKNTPQQAADDELPSGCLMRQRSSRRGRSRRSNAELRLRRSTTRRNKTDAHIPVSDTIDTNVSAVEINNEIFDEDTEDGEVPSKEEEAVPNRLHDRLAVQRKEGELKMVSTTPWEEFIHTKWPKIRRKLTSWRGLELWSTHMKYISNHYGSGVYSYYNSLRWLFLVNVVLGLILTVFLIIPQFLWRARVEGLADRERILDTAYRCINPISMSNGTNCTAGCVEVYDACDAANSTVDVPECTLVNPPGSPLLRVTAEMICRDVINRTRCLCPREITFGQGLLDFINGEGLFATSELFIGWYTHTVIGGVYDMPVVYLLVWGLVYTLSLLFTAYRIGSSFKEFFIFNSKVVAKSRRNVCNRVFTGWDFNISDKGSAVAQHRSAKRSLEELAGELATIRPDRARNEILKVILIRLAINTFIVSSLVAGGVSIWFAVDAELRVINTSLLSTTVITLVNFVFPKIYAFLVEYERYQSPRTAVLITTLRFLIVRLFSYIILLLSVIIQINCTQPDPQSSGAQCTLDLSQGFRELSAGREEEICPSCWETVVGQKFYTNAVVNVAVSIVGTIGLDILQNILSRVEWPIVGKYFSREFDVPENIIDLVETMIIFWLGSFFCPMISIIITIHLFILFYVKKYSMQFNLEPSKDLYLATKRDLGFLFILLFTGLVCIIPVGYAITRLVPSPSCGPFRRSSFIYSVIDERIELLSCDAQAIVGFIVSSSFLLIVILILILVCIGFILTLHARNKHVDLLSKQCKSESVDKSYLSEMAEIARRQLAMYEQEEEPDTLVRKRNLSMVSVEPVFSHSEVGISELSVQSPTANEGTDSGISQVNVGSPPRRTSKSHARQAKRESADYLGWDTLEKGRIRGESFVQLPPAKEGTDSGISQVNVGSPPHRSSKSHARQARSESVDYLEWGTLEKRNANLRKMSKFNTLGPGNSSTWATGLRPRSTSTLPASTEELEVNSERLVD